MIQPRVTSYLNPATVHEFSGVFFLRFSNIFGSVQKTCVQIPAIPLADQSRYRGNPHLILASHMSSTPVVRSTKLKFKGEKLKKKRKREDGETSERHTRRRKDDDDLSPESWVLPEDPLEIRGPTFLMHPSDPTPLCVTYDSTRRKVLLHSMTKSEDEEETNVLDRTPAEVSQVWVSTRVAGSPTINLRTGAGEGKFLSCDKLGIVAADREARGPQEEWTPVIMSGGMVAFMNVYEKYLSVDEVAGGALQLRGDSEEVGFRERFWVKIQHKYKQEAHAEEKKKKEGIAGDTNIDEAATK
jgi:protein FRG1